MNEKIIRVHRVLIDTIVYSDGEIKINTQEKDITQEYNQCNNQVQPIEGSINITMSFQSHYVLSIPKKSPLAKALADINTITVLFHQDKYLGTVDLRGGRISGLGRMVNAHKEKFVVGMQFFASYNQSTNELSLKLLSEKV